MGEERMHGRELETELDSLRSTQKICNWLGNICMGVGVIMIFLKQLLGFIVFMVIAIILWGKSSSAAKRIKELLSDNVITSVGRQKREKANAKQCQHG